MHGRLPVDLAVQRRIKRAELWAVVQALRHAAPPLVVHTDHLGIVTGIARGRAWCVAARRPHADIWLALWGFLESLNGNEAETLRSSPAVSVRHCKAHRAAKAVLELQGPDRQVALGNGVADLLAKAGAVLDTGSGRDQTLADSKVTWALEHIAWWHNEVGDFEDVALRAVAPPPLPPAQGDLLGRALPLDIGPARPHNLEPRRKGEVANGGVRCLSCPRWSSTSRGEERTRKQECRGPALPPKDEADRRSETFICLNGHALMESGSLTWCLLCGCYTETRSRGLKTACLGRPSLPTRRNR